MAVTERGRGQLVSLDILHHIGEMREPLVGPERPVAPPQDLGREQGIAEVGEQPSVAEGDARTSHSEAFLRVGHRFGRPTVNQPQTARSEHGNVSHCIGMTPKWDGQTPLVRFQAATGKWGGQGAKLWV
jgi:hypothetical protein